MINFYKQFKSKKSHNPNYDAHKIEIPFRAIINCASGGGKSNLCLNILHEMFNTFHKIIIVSKAEEPLYDYLTDKLKNVSIFYNGAVPDNIEKMDTGCNGLLIFDDMVLSKNNTIGEMFIRGRKLGWSLIYITQSFYQTAKILRQNSNLIWLGHGLSKRDLRLILSEFAIPMTIDELQKLYMDLTKEKMNFMLIDINSRNIRKNIKDIVLEY